MNPLLTLNEIFLMSWGAWAAHAEIEVFLVDSMALVFFVDLNHVQGRKSLRA